MQKISPKTLGVLLFPDFELVDIFGLLGKC